MSWRRNDGEETTLQEVMNNQTKKPNGNIQGAQKSLEFHTDARQTKEKQMVSAAGELGLITGSDGSQKNNRVKQLKEANMCLSEDKTQHVGVNQKVLQIKSNMLGVATNVINVVQMKQLNADEKETNLGQENKTEPKQLKKFKRRNGGRNGTARGNIVVGEKKRQFEGDTMEVDDKKKKMKKDVVMEDLNKTNEIMEAGLQGQLRGAQ
jgi:hypothetical protein